MVLLRAHEMILSLNILGPYESIKCRPAVPIIFKFVFFLLSSYLEEMPNSQNKEKSERGGSAAAKVKKRKANVQRSNTFSSSYENKRKIDVESNNQEKKTTPTGSPFPEPKYTKAVYLLLEAKKLAREIEERKEKGELFRNKLRGSMNQKSVSSIFHL